MSDGTPPGWVAIRLSSTTLWLQEPVLPDLVAVSRVRVAGPEETGWEHDALVPGEDWQPIGGAPATDDGVRFRSYRDVAVLRLPDVTRLERWRDRDRRLRRRVRRALRSRARQWWRLVPFVVHRLGGYADVLRRRPDPAFERRLLQLGRIDQFIGAKDDLPGLSTTAAADVPDRRRVGLHLDNWDSRTAKERHDSRNRVSVNLGEESRWFLFVDHDVASLYDAGTKPTTASVRGLVHDRSLAVVRVRVPPGWAYIAPTENLLHDACTVGQERGTRHASALGMFDPAHGSKVLRVTAIDAEVAVST